MMNKNLTNIAKTYAEDNNCGLPLTAEQLLNAVADKVIELEDSGGSSGGGGTTVVANSGETATEELQTLTVGSTTYEVPSGGDTVEANPSESGTEDLTSIKIDGSVYNIPSSGGGSSATLYRHYILFRVGTVTAFVSMDYYNYSATAFTSSTLLAELKGVNHSLCGGDTASGGFYQITGGSDFTATYNTGTTPGEEVIVAFVSDTVYEVS